MSRHKVHNMNTHSLQNANIYPINNSDLETEYHAENPRNIILFTISNYFGLNSIVFPKRPGAELGGSQGATAPQKFCLTPQWPPQNFSGLFLKVLHRPLTAPLVAKLAPPVVHQIKMSGSTPAKD